MNKSLPAENQRFKIIRESLKMSQAQFAGALGRQQGSISDIERGRNSVDGIVQLLKLKFNVNEDWLRTGNGEMFNGLSQGDSFTPSQIIKRVQEAINSNSNTVGSIDYPLHPGQTSIPIGEGKYLMIVPMVPEYSYAGYLSGWRDPEYIESLQKHTLVVDREPHSEYLAFEVVGDSMRDPDNIEESILDGDIVTGRSLEKVYWRSKFHTHRWKDFVIMHKDGILTKRIKHHNVPKGIITLESINPDKETYPDRDIHLDDVKQIFNIINISRPRR